MIQAFKAIQEVSFYYDSENGYYVIIDAKPFFEALYTPEQFFRKFKIPTQSGIDSEHAEIFERHEREHGNESY